LRTAADIQHQSVQSESEARPHNTRLTPSEIQRPKKIGLPGIFNHEANNSEVETPPPIPARFGRVSLSNTETTYVCSSHWTAILEQVAVFHILLYSVITVRLTKIIYRLRTSILPHGMMEVMENIQRVSIEDQGFLYLLLSFIPSFT
jgi:hypothetical protein